MGMGNGEIYTYIIVCAFGRIKARQVDTDMGPTDKEADRQTGERCEVSVFGLLLLLLLSLAKLYYDLFKIQI